MQGPDDLELLIQAAQDAGEIALRYWQRDPKAWDKPDQAGPVTEADLEIDEMLRTRLCAARPDYGWLSEETCDDHARLTTARQFIVDPIDGTRAFIEGQKAFSHALAICEGGQIQTAVVFVPARELLYTAKAGHGAFVNGTELRGVAQPNSPPDLLSTKPNFKPENWPGGVPVVKRHFRSSLAFRMALSAEGRFDGMLTLRDSWEWDIAAGALLCAEAGLVVSDRFGAPLRFNNPEPKTRGAMALPAGLHADYLARLTA